MGSWEAARIDDTTAAALKVAALDALSARVAVIDVDGTVLTVNHAWRAFAARRALPTHARVEVGADYLAAVDQGTLDLPGTALPTAAAAGLRSVLTGERPRYQCEYSLPCPGGPQWFLMVVTSLGGAGFGPAVVAHIEVAGRRQIDPAAGASPDGLHDPLTGLPAKTLLRDRLAMALAQRPIDERRTAVFVVGFDDLELVAADLGQTVADEVLIEVVRRLQAVVRPGDTIARITGSQIAFVFTAVRGEMGVQAFRMRLGRVLSEPVRVTGHPAPVWIRSTVGSAFDGVDGVEPDGLLRAADQARSVGRTTNR
jgi:diguanylate cyclase (GGDEF)-like protein